MPADRTTVQTQPRTERESPAKRTVNNAVSPLAEPNNYQPVDRPRVHRESNPELTFIAVFGGSAVLVATGQVHHVTAIGVLTALLLASMAGYVVVKMIRSRRPTP